MCKNIANKISRPFCLPHDEADGPGLQGRDLRNSQAYGFPSELLHYALFETSKKAS